ncbi:hypothetical protein ANN_23506 [Periplaneta americana]|uniref:Uncharacterized protein n=1 Tax=Periplaneta americana TaxID=6978 RepID=A0ABQ8SL98_PERAM|nr:hypothetical protein ANN_23506 [Periplaneta americana]
MYSGGRLAGLLIRSCARAWVGSPFGLIDWFLQRFSPAVGLIRVVYGESSASLHCTGVWSDYLVGFFPRFSATIRQMPETGTFASYRHSIAKQVQLSSSHAVYKFPRLTLECWCMGTAPLTAKTSAHQLTYKSGIVQEGQRKKSVRWPTKVPEDAVEDARERMQGGPNKSVKKLAVEIGVSCGSAHKILRNKLVGVNKGDDVCVTSQLSPGNMGEETIGFLLYQGNIAAFNGSQLKDGSSRHCVLQDKIFGPIEENGHCGIRKNKELRSLYLKPDIVTVALVKSRRLGWLGHIIREEQSLKKVIWEQLPDGRRCLGRSRFRWNDQVQRDLERKGGNRTMAEDRGAWNKIVTEAKNLRYGHTSLLLQQCSTKNCATFTLRRLNNGATRKVAAVEPAARYFFMLRAA